MEAGPLASISGAGFMYREIVHELPRAYRTREAVLRAVGLRFPPGRRAAIMAALDRSGPGCDLSRSPRLQLAILAAAGDDESRVEGLSAVAILDFRDVIVAAYVGDYPERPTGRVEHQKKLFAAPGISYPEDRPARPRRQGR